MSTVTIIPRGGIAKDAISSHLASDRLTLDLVRDQDVDALHALAGELLVCRHVFAERPPNHVQVSGLIARSTFLHTVSGTGVWAIRRRAGSGIIGIAALWPHQYEAGSPPRMELVFALSARYEGAGFAAEACDTLIDYARKRLGWSVLHSRVDLHNTEANRLLWRLGFVEHMVVRGPTGPLRISALELSRPLSLLF